MLFEEPLYIFRRLLLESAVFLRIRRNDYQLILIERHIFTVLLLKYRSGKAYVRHVVYDLRYNLRTVRLYDLDLFVRILLIEPDQHLRQKILRRYRRRRNRDTVLFSVLLRTEPLFYLLLQIHDLSGIFVHILSVIRQAYFLRIPDEQPDSQFLLQRSNMGADGRLRQIQFFGCFREAAAFCHLDKSL